MRIRIIKNLSKTDGPENITPFIGRTFYTESQGKDGTVSVDFGLIGTLTVYPKEYEIVDFTKELVKLVDNYYPLSGLYPQDTIDFILANKTALSKILRES